MRVDDDFQAMIEWGEEEKQSDFVEFIKRIRDAYNDKKPIIIEQDGVEAEIEINIPVLNFKKPFPDFDMALMYKRDDKKKPTGSFRWRVTYMHMIKKIDENKFHITAEESPEGTVTFK